MKRTMAAALGATALLLSACGSGDTEVAPEPTNVETSETASAMPAEIPIEIGTPFEVASPEGVLGTVTVQAIEVNPACTAMYGEPETAENGVFVGVQMRVETTPMHDETKFMRTTSRDFSEVTPAGVTKPVNTQSDCIADRDGFKQPFDPGSTYEGWVTLDVTDAASTLKYKPQYAPLGSPVWTVAIPASATPVATQLAPSATAAPTPAAEMPTVTGPPNPYPNSRDSYGRGTGTSGAEFVECADPDLYQQGTGVFSDGSMDYAPQCSG